MASENKIADDDAYEKSNAWLVMKALEIIDPLISEDEKAKLQRQYDYVAEEMERYRRGKRILQHPGLRDQYDQLGYKYYVFDQPAEPTAVTPESEPPQPEPEPPKKPVYNYFDDDD
ncbi:hypothetical protein [Paenibacillus cymbidii]|uniref:hypothetical protein n=1 Tax=Paenibacillus cymbidii TaxID=1639034 RepID=UPI00107FEF41|nr:hypothetical protein [Paenibacillus cymbidii]